MTEKLVESRAVVPWATVFLLCVGGGLLITALVLQVVHWALAAALPFLMSVALLFARPPVFAAEFATEAIEATQPEARVPYVSIEGLRVKGRSSDPNTAGPRSYPIAVIYQGGVLEIPANLNVPSDDVFAYLCSRVPKCGSREVHPALVSYLKKQEDLFGAERVFTYCARSIGAGFFFPRKAFAAFVAMLLTGIIWVVLGFKHQPWLNWGIVGILTAVVGVFGAIVILGEKGSAAKKHSKYVRRASLVISPFGLAIVQGEDQGEMRWDELRDLRIRDQPGSFESSRAERGIVLIMDAAQFVIADIFDRPLCVIYEQTKQYWRRKGN